MNVLQRCRTLLLLYFAPMLVALARPDRLNELFRFSRQFRRSEQSMGMDIFVGYVGRETHVGRGRPARNRKTADARRGPHLEGPETLGCRGGCVPRLCRDAAHPRPRPELRAAQPAVDARHVPHAPARALELHEQLGGNCQRSSPSLVTVSSCPSPPSRRPKCSRLRQRARSSEAHLWVETGSIRSPACRLGDLPQA